jgi:hypothetical protein
MKFVIRRAVVGVMAMPLIAGLYVAIYTWFVLVGGEPNQTLNEVWNTGLWIGGVVAVLFAGMTRKVVKALIG